MILEVEQAIDRVQEAIETYLIDAAVQDPGDALNVGITTHVVACEGDGDIVFIEGAIDVRELAELVVGELGLGRAA